MGSINIPLWGGVLGWITCVILIRRNAGMLAIVHGLPSFLERGKVSCVALHPGVASLAAESMGTT